MAQIPEAQVHFTLDFFQIKSEIKWRMKWNMNEIKYWIRCEVKYLDKEIKLSPDPSVVDQTSSLYGQQDTFAH